MCLLKGIDNIDTHKVVIELKNIKPIISSAISIPVFKFTV